MTAQILDGKIVSQATLAEVGKEVAALGGALKPHLTVVLVGNNPASEVYVSRKIKVSGELGISSELTRFPSDVSETELIDYLEELNRNEQVHAVLVQLPLPGHINTERVLDTVIPEKDVDGFHPMNLGRLVMGIEPPAMPCTPAGIIRLLDHYDIALSGMRAAVVGRSNIVGKPMAMMLTHRDATVTLCHSRTRNLDDILRGADLVVAAIGRARMIHADMIKPGAVVVDVGMNRLETGKLVGDVDFDGVSQRAGWITPVPGGVGPMTIAMLMNNTLRLFRLQQGQQPRNLLFV